MVTLPPAYVEILVVHARVDTHQAGADEAGAVVNRRTAAEAGVRWIAELTPQLIADVVQVAQSRAGGAAAPRGLDSGGAGPAPAKTQVRAGGTAAPRGLDSGSAGPAATAEALAARH